MQSRKVYYDAMRIVAILLVLYNHLPGYHLFYKGVGAALVGGMAMSVVTRVGVPLFAMVSGALLLGRHETYRELWQKRISRMLLVVLLFEGLLYVEFHFTRQYPLSLSGFVFGMFGGTLKSLTSYWFLYAYLGFLIMLPFLRMVAQHMRRDDFLWLMGVHVLFSTVVPLVGFACKCAELPKFAVSANLSVALSSVSLFFYPLIGYWLDRHVDVQRITRRQWMLMALAVLLGIGLCGLLTWHHNQRFGGHVQDYLGLTVYVTAICAFLLFKRCFDANFVLRHPRLSRALCFVGPLVFGVYLMDQGLKLLLYEPLKSALFSALGSFGFSLVWCALSLVVCGAVTWVLRRLPLFSKLL